MFSLHLDLIFHTGFSLVFLTYFVKTYFPRDFLSLPYRNVSCFTYFFSPFSWNHSTRQSFYGGLSYLWRISGRPYLVFCVSFSLFSRSNNILFSDIHTWLIDFKYYQHMLLIFCKRILWTFTQYVYNICTT